jgi:CBS domain containing-hemolysin-like protein
MIVWIGLAAGLAISALGTTIAVSAAAVSRIELTRWISQRLRGAAVASTLFAAPGHMLRTGTAVGTVGVLLTGAALAASLRTLPFGVTLVAIAAIPVVAAAVSGVARAVGQRWPDDILRRSTPLVRRLSVFRMLMPLGSDEKRPTLSGALLAGDAGDSASAEEIRVISGVLAFTERQARDLMTPRTEIVALQEGASLEQVARIFSESGYSRIPVYRDSLDNIIGMIYAFDLLKVTPGGELPLRPVAVTPGSKECAALLLDLQRERRQLAVVLDEFGGTAGIVTLEDLLEELVGEIFDDDEPLIDSGGWGPDLIEVNGTAPTTEVASHFGVDLPGEAETIGGLIARHAGRIPQPGERLHYQGLEFDVLQATPTRVDRLAVRRGPVRSVNLPARPQRHDS